MKDINKEFGPSSWAVDNKTAIYVLVVIIAIMGYFSYNNLPKENFPEIIIPKIIRVDGLSRNLACEYGEFGN